MISIHQPGHGCTDTEDGSGDNRGFDAVFSAVKDADFGNGEFQDARSGGFLMSADAQPEEGKKQEIPCKMRSAANPDILKPKQQEGKNEGDEG